MTTPLIQGSSQGMSSYRAAEYSVQVDTADDDTTPTWVFWYGINKFDPSADPTLQDDSDKDSRGFKSQTVTATSLDIAVEGAFKGTRAADAIPLDPGCAHVRGKKGKVGANNEVHLRYWRNDDLDNGKAFEHWFAVSWKDVGGSNEEIMKFTADLRGRGEPIETTVPVTP